MREIEAAPLPTRAIGSAAVVGAKPHSKARDAGVLAAVSLLSEYDGGRLLEDPTVAPHLHWVSGRAEMVVDWVSLFDDMSLRSPRHDQSEQTWSVLLIAGSLAIGRALHGFGTLLSYLDHRTTSQLIRAIYIASHGGAHPAPGWPDSEPIVLSVLAEVEAAFIKARLPQD